MFVLLILIGATGSSQNETSPAPRACRVMLRNPGPELSDADYISSVQKNVLPDIQTGEGDIVDPTVHSGS